MSFRSSSTIIVRAASSAAVRPAARAPVVAFQARRGYADNTKNGGVMEKVGEAVKKTAQAFSADGGSVGSQFKSDGAVGSTAEQVGGEFSSKQGGDIGSKFEKDGSIGGKAQELSDKAWDAGKKMKGEK